MHPSDDETGVDHRVDENAGVSGRRGLERPVVQPSQIETGAPTYASYARSIVRARSRLRSRLDPDMFGDPAFDMLLELFAAKEEGTEPSLKNVALVTDLPMTTALRWIRLLEARGFVERSSDASDRRRTLLRIKPDVEGVIRTWLREISSIPLRQY